MTERNPTKTRKWSDEQVRLMRALWAKDRDFISIQQQFGIGKASLIHVLRRWSYRNVR